MTTWFLLLALFCVAVEGVFSMFEMASVSLNKVRLQYEALHKKKKKAIWVNSLIDNPSKLFGTTLLVVNTVLQIGSEAARRFYESIGLSPDLAAISQTVIVLMFGELVPLFASRKCPEHTVDLFIPVIYFISKVLTPFIWVVNGLSHVINYLFQKEETQYYLSREEIERAIEEKEKEKSVEAIVGNIFSLKSKSVKHAMIGLDTVDMVSSHAMIGEVRQVFENNDFSFIPIYHHLMHNVVSIVFPRDLLMIGEKERVIDHGQSPWFVAEDASIFQIIQEFRLNNQSVAVVINKEGKAIGFLTLDEIVDEMLGESNPFFQKPKKCKKVAMERTLLGDLALEQFNNQFHCQLTYKDAITLNDLITMILDRHPLAGDVVRIDQFEMIVLEVSLLGVKTVLVKTII